MRFATATAASLIFPFAPHLGGEVFERLTRRAGLGAALARGRPGPARQRHRDPDRPGQRQAARPHRGWRRRPAEELLRLARASEKVDKHLDGKELVKEIVVPGKLVNLVVR